MEYIEAIKRCRMLWKRRKLRRRDDWEDSLDYTCFMVYLRMKCYSLKNKIEKKY